MGTVVNIVIGTAFVFLIFSLVVSGVNEGLTAVFAIRSKILWQTLTGLAATSEAPEKLRLMRVLPLPFTAPWIERLPIIGRWAKGWTDPRPRVEENVPKDVVAAYVPNQDASDAGGAAPFIKGVLSRSERFDTSRKGRPTRVKHVSPQVISQVMIGWRGSSHRWPARPTAPCSRGSCSCSRSCSAAIKGTQLEAPVRAAMAGRRETSTSSGPGSRTGSTLAWAPCPASTRCGRAGPCWASAWWSRSSSTSTRSAPSTRCARTPPWRRRRWTRRRSSPRRSIPRATCAARRRATRLRRPPRPPTGSASATGRCRTRWPRAGRSRRR